MEIQVPLDLDERESTLLDMHGVLNILNVINHELILISEWTGDEPTLMKLMEKVSEAGTMLGDPQKSITLIEGIDNLIEDIEASLDQSTSGLATSAITKLEPHRNNLRTIYSILRIRSGEIMARHQLPDVWVDHRISKLKGNFSTFLSAVEKNSHGRYRIVQNIAAQGESDYLITFEISSETGDSLRMPIIFQDVMRDLLANARKYTNPGGTIHGGLHATDEGLRFLIKDNGIGIPEDSIEDVVLFGKRATNVANRETRGGGFGLTKAYYITRLHQGRMWIDSSTEEGEHKGTRIEIFIPYGKN